MKFSTKTDQSDWKSIGFDWISASVGFCGFLISSISKKANEEKNKEIDPENRNKEQTRNINPAN